MLSWKSNGDSPSSIVSFLHRKPIRFALLGAWIVVTVLLAFELGFYLGSSGGEAPASRKNSMVGCVRLPLSTLTLHCVR